MVGVAGAIARVLDRCVICRVNIIVHVRWVGNRHIRAVAAVIGARYELDGRHYEVTSQISPLLPWELVGSEDET